MHCKPVSNLQNTGKRNLLTSTDKFDDSTGNYTQTVLVNGETVSTLSTSDGRAQGWGSAVECAEDNCGTMPAHSKNRNANLSFSGK
jgi:hypothetical protein